MMLLMAVFVGVVLVAVGRWGSGRVPDLVTDLDEEVREKKIRTMRRGVIVVQVAGVVLLALVAYIVIRSITH